MKNCPDISIWESLRGLGFVNVVAVVVVDIIVLEVVVVGWVKNFHGS